MPTHVSGKFATPIDRGAVAADWQLRGYSCNVFVDPPGRSWKDFVHDRNELITVVTGRLFLTVDGKEHTLEPGDETLIPRGSLHSVFNIHKGETHWLYGYD